MKQKKIGSDQQSQSKVWTVNRGNPHILRQPETKLEDLDRYEENFRRAKAEVEKAEHSLKLFR